MAKPYPEDLRVAGQDDGIYQLSRALLHREMGSVSPANRRSYRSARAIPFYLPAIQPRSQSHRATIRQTQGAPAQSRRIYSQGRRIHRQEPLQGRCQLSASTSLSQRPSLNPPRTRPYS
jgi:hypothetical protein